MSLKHRDIMIILLFLAIPRLGYPYDMLVSVSAYFTGNTCDISNDSIEKKVELGSVGVKQFNSSTSAISNKVMFSLNLENCGAAFSGVKVKFTATPDPLMPQLIKIEEGGATGIAIEILDNKEQVIPLNSLSNTYGSPGDDIVNINLYARMVSNGNNITPGRVTAVATWTMEYL
ncbi:fimbrial protein [Klebsiella aerogenes]